MKKEESLGKVNYQLIEIKVLHEIKEANIKVHYMEYKGYWPVANRDFVNVAIGLEETMDKVYIGTKASDYPCPEKKGVVRGEVFIGAYIIERVDEKQTRITYISDVDLKGSIPNFLKNGLSHLQGDIAYKVEEIMKK